jgi:hypothetical protein
MVMPRISDGTVIVVSTASVVPLITETNDFPALASTLAT